MEVTISYTDIPILMFIIFLFWMATDIRNESEAQTRYLEKIQQQNHMLLLYKEYETKRDVIYIDSINTYRMQDSELFKK